ncbi:MAG TPA: hypothetical protein VG938_04240 [Verrucomicrobiae bacterium]|nr:hypothetical protein [Verrucomicrobiae bacterium]
MKAILKAILLPAFLGAGGFVGGYYYRETTALTSPPAPVTAVDSRSAEAPAPSEKESTNPPFQWRQLESTDYHIYISNLRRIGCPEQTIRDIITADVHSVFDKRRQQLGPAGDSQRSELAELLQEENLFLAGLLGPQLKDGSNQVATGVSPAQAMLARSPVSIPALPLVLQNADLTALKLNPAQMEILDTLRQKFRNEIGTAQDPSDSAYRERWLKAQHESDDLLRGMLGTEVFMNYEGLIAKQQP